MSIRKGDKIIASSGGGGGTNVLVDNNTIVKNDSDVITTVGVQTKDGGTKYDWVGTLSEYNAGVKAGTIQDDWFCYITDDEEVAMHRYMGELVSSIMPIMDASGETPKSLHLLDGELISSSGLYKSFAEYLDKAIELFPSLGGTESEWQEFATEFGEVPFFVVDKTNFTIRLPLIKNPIQGVTDLSNLGSLLEAGCEKSSVLTSPIVQPAGCYYIVLSPNSASIDGLDDYVADIKEEILGKVEEVSGNFKPALDSKVSKSGDTMTGELFLDGGNIRMQQNGISQAINTKNTAFVLADGAPSKAQPGFRMNSTDANGVITHYYQTDNPTNGDTYTAISNTVYVDGATKYYPFIIGVTSANVPYLKYDGKTMRYVTDTYMSGGSWYRVYNDGWCEQGGMNNSGNINGWQTVNFIKPYKASSIYFISVVEVNSSERKFNIDGTHNNYFRYEAIDVPAEKIRWFSCGFIE